MRVVLADTGAIATAIAGSEAALSSIPDVPSWVGGVVVVLCGLIVSVVRELLADRSLKRQREAARLELEEELSRAKLRKEISDVTSETDRP